MESETVCLKQVTSPFLAYLTNPFTGLQFPNSSHNNFLLSNYGRATDSRNFISKSVDVIMINEIL